jgi:hypothetical protein
VSEDLERDEVHQAVDRLVDELLEKAGLAAPPVDAIALAQRHLGLVVCLDDGPPQRGRAQRAAGRKPVFPRPEPTEEHRQWTVARQIGMHFKAEILRRLGVPPDQTRARAGESLANLLAHRLLAPTAWFGGDARACGYELPELKQRYRTASHEVLAWRLLDLPEPCVITVLDNGHVQRRRSNAWRVRRELEAPERECQRYVNHYSRPHVVRAGGWTVQGWPVHRPDWKREILRSVSDGDGAAG